MVYPDDIDILPEYTLNGKSPMNLNGNTLDIFFSHIGRNGNGIIEPMNTVEMVIYIFSVPFSSNVNIVNIVIIKFSDVTSRHASINDIVNIIKASSDIGIDKWNGYGNNDATIITSHALSNTFTILFDNAFTYHLK